MSAWPGKFVIGLTGNIATGKSTVMKLLEHLGALCIDADMLAKEAVAKGAPGYYPVLDYFGSWLIGSDGQINREALGELVFSDQTKLKKLEEIVHPLVYNAVDAIIRHSSRAVIVIEAIKLFESGLSADCDTVWLTISTPELQLHRLMEMRGMDERLARQRMDAQPGYDNDCHANVVIQNSGSISNLWNQVLDAWRESLPENLQNNSFRVSLDSSADGRIIQWAAQRDWPLIVELVDRANVSQNGVISAKINSSFAETAYLLYWKNRELCGLTGWNAKIESTLIEVIFISNDLDINDSLTAMLREIKSISIALGCKILLVMLPSGLQQFEGHLHFYNLEPVDSTSVSLDLWREAVSEQLATSSIWKMDLTQENPGLESVRL